MTFFYSNFFLYTILQNRQETIETFTVRTVWLPMYGPEPLYRPKATPTYVNHLVLAGTFVQYMYVYMYTFYIHIHTPLSVYK